MTNILIFYGPTSEFEKIIENYKDNALSLYEILESTKDSVGGKEEATVVLAEYYESIIINSNDFASLSETGLRILNHVLTQFVKHFNIKNVFMQNPTEVIEKNIKLMINNNEEYDLEIRENQYPQITKELLVEIYQQYSSHIIGQDSVKEEILSAFYKLYKKRNKKEPLVIMFYGPSGVGKTESVNYISKALSGEQPFRAQMSMFQNNKSLDYLFGENHNTKSFALDLLERETNIILLDEFDKTFETVYSAFYQMFDEGVFEDRNFKVNLEDTIIICTSNYSSKNDIRNTIGAPLYYRFNRLIKFQPLDRKSVLSIVDLIYTNSINELDDDERKIIVESGLIDYIRNKIDTILENSTPNYRQIENTIEDLINSLLIEELILIVEKNEN